MPGSRRPVGRSRIRWPWRIRHASTWPPSPPGLWWCERIDGQRSIMVLRTLHLHWEIPVPLHENFSWMGEEPIFVVVQQLGAAQSAFIHSAYIFLLDFTQLKRIFFFNKWYLPKLLGIKFESVINDLKCRLIIKIIFFYFLRSSRPNTPVFLFQWCASQGWGFVCFLFLFFFIIKEQVLKQIYFKSLNKMHWCKILKWKALLQTLVCAKGENWSRLWMLKHPCLLKYSFLLWF